MTIITNDLRKFAEIFQDWGKRQNNKLLNNFEKSMKKFRKIFLESSENFKKIFNYEINFKFSTEAEN